ncbi:HpaII family restriction endonuclease [bacterium]|nr:HpaII family restriction endonuclease [bacterium]
MKITGNKGEWSELYALLKLLALGKLYTANEFGEKEDSIFFPVLKILRDERESGHLSFVLSPKTRSVDFYVEEQQRDSFEANWVSDSAESVYSGILGGRGSAFEIEGAADIMDKMNLKRIKAISDDKADIIIQIHDIKTGYEPICGFSIKSDLGNPPTLLNASKATNFTYELNNISDDNMEKINNIETKTKIIDRINAIFNIGSMRYLGMHNQIFRSNLMLIDTIMDRIIAEMLLHYYKGEGDTCKELIDILETQNPLRYPRNGCYEYKLKKFLYSVALGMVPAKLWDGLDQANGGYVIVKQNGDVLAFHLYNKNAFETYLLNNTKFEKASTSRNDFATIYSNKGRKLINLNLQIRFV